MKSFEEIRRDVISDISIGEMLGTDKQYSFAQVEKLAAKEYAKQWIEEAAYIAMSNAEVGDPVGNAILKLTEQIDAQ